jgi:predicted permease
MGGLLQDVKYGFRQLRRSPALATVAIVTLALGIGVTTAIFGVIDSWLLKSLPVPNAGRITVMTAEQPGSILTQFSLPEFRDYKKHPGPFADVFGYALNVVGLSQHRRADHILVSYVTGNYFSSLGLKPYLGRLILPSEGQAPGASPVIVLGYDYWKSRFDSDRGIIGQSVRVDGQPVTVVGVTPPDFKGTFPFLKMKAYLPISIMGSSSGASSSIWTNRKAHMLDLLGRLKPGATIAEAQAAMNVEAALLAQQYPESERGYAIYVYPQRLARPPEPHQYMRQGMIAALFLVLGGLVLLVACFNVASMLIARALGRKREMALRVALGAGRARLLRQTLAETLVLALIGGGAGLLLGEWLVSLLGLIHMKGTLSLQLDIGFDWRVYLFAFLVCLATGVVVGIAPAFRASRANPNEELREGGARLSGGIRSARLRRALVVTQLAGSLVLLIVAGLFVRSLSRAENVDLGFDPHGVLDLSMNPGDVGYSKAQTVQFYKSLLDRVRATPGVQSAALAVGAPLSGYSSGAAAVHVEGRVLGPDQHAPQIFFNSVSPGYFRTMRVALLHGRTFTKADDAKAPPVAIINQAMAKQLWPGQNPLGRRFRTSKKGPWINVVGVSANATYLFVALRNEAYFYRPMAQSYSHLRTLQIRSSIAPDALALEIQKEIHSLEPQLPLFDVGPLGGVVNGPNGLLIFRLGAAVAGGLGLLGLLLAVVGLYGVIAYTVSQRRHEIAIRMAIGAAERDILLGVLRDGGWMVGIGWVIGFVLALLAARAASGILMGVGFLDPLTYIAASLALGLVALLACYLPARRAMRVDPATALRYE